MTLTKTGKFPHYWQEVQHFISNKEVNIKNKKQNSIILQVKDSKAIRKEAFVN